MSDGVGGLLGSLVIPVPNQR